MESHITYNTATKHMGAVTGEQNTFVPVTDRISQERSMALLGGKVSGLVVYITGIYALCSYVQETHFLFNTLICADYLQGLCDVLFICHSDKWTSLFNITMILYLYFIFIKLFIYSSQRLIQGFYHIPVVIRYLCHLIYSCFYQYAQWAVKWQLSVSSFPYIECNITLQYFQQADRSASWRARTHTTGTVSGRRHWHSPAAWHM